MLDTDYPHFPSQNCAPAPPIEAKSLANLTGFTECFLLLLAKKCASQASNFLPSRPKIPHCTQVRGRGVLSRGEARDELLG